MPQIRKQGWTVGKTLGQGAFGLVKLVTKANTSAACKIIAKPKDQAEMAAIEMEYVIMTGSAHPGIVKMYEGIQTLSNVFFFLELVAGGELFDYIIAKGSFTEHMAAEVTVQCLSALQYLHSRGTVHRDLKPENILLSKKMDLTNVKLTDFGLSAKMDHQSAALRDAVGTPGYVAPEILTVAQTGGYDKQVDVWSMGCIIYILLCGQAPFFSNNDRLMYEKIKRGAYQFVRPQFDSVSEGAKAFVAQMLLVAPTARSTISVLLADRWLVTAGDFDLAGGQAEYCSSLKETEDKLAAQRKFELGISVAKAQIRLARAMKRALKRARARKQQAAPAVGATRWGKINGFLGNISSLSPLSKNDAVDISSPYQANYEPAMKATQGATVPETVPPPSTYASPSRSNTGAKVKDVWAATINTAKAAQEAEMKKWRQQAAAAKAKEAAAAANEAAAAKAKERSELDVWVREARAAKAKEAAELAEWKRQAQAAKEREAAQIQARVRAAKTAVVR